MPNLSREQSESGRSSPQSVFASSRRRASSEIAANILGLIADSEMGDSQDPSGGKESRKGMSRAQRKSYDGLVNDNEDDEEVEMQPAAAQASTPTGGGARDFDDLL